MKNKDIIRWIVIICIIVLGLIGIIPLIRWINSKTVTENTMGEDVYYISKKYPTKLLIMGADPEFDDSIVSCEVNCIDYNDIVNNSTEYELHVVIINDMDGSVDISDDDYASLKRLLEEHRINVYYLGTDKTQEFISRNLWDGSWEINDNECGLCMEQAAFGMLNYTQGALTKDTLNDTANMKQILYNLIASSLKYIHLEPQ